MYELLITACLMNSCKVHKFPASDMNTPYMCIMKGQEVAAKELPGWTIKGYKCKLIDKDVAKI